MTLYDQLLARWPVSHEMLHVPTRHGRTFMVASGDVGAHPLILLHGSCSNAGAWMGDVAVYSDCFRVYAVDLPGEPGRSDPIRPAWDSPAFAEWLLDILDHLSIETVSLLGISQGGWTALRFATTYPDRVQRLVLLAPGGVVPARLSFFMRALLFSLAGRRGAEALTRYTFGDTPIPEEVNTFMNVSLTHFKPRIGVQPVFTDEELQRLTMPKLLIAGEKDALLPSERTAARLKKLLPDLTVTLLPDEGHVLMNLTHTVIPFCCGMAHERPAKDGVIINTSC